MKIRLQDRSPSATDRGRDNDLHEVQPSEVHARVDVGTVWVFLYADEDAPLDGNADLAIQFWQGWINQLFPKIGSSFGARAAELFAPHEGGTRLSQEELTQLLTQCLALN